MLLRLPLPIPGRWPVPYMGEHSARLAAGAAPLRRCSRTAAPGQPTASTIAQAFGATAGAGWRELGAALRILRQLVVARVPGARLHPGRPAWPEVTASMTALAELAFGCRLHPGPNRPQPAPRPAARPPWPGGALLWIVGMGKLEERQLNVSSDIDLIYVYGHRGRGPPGAMPWARASFERPFSTSPAWCA